MGYTTDFTGAFKLDAPLTAAQVAYLNKFSETRRMKRDATATEKRDDPVRLAVGLPVGPQGGYFVGANGMAGQEEAPDILDWNGPPEGQPGLWCQWVPSDDGTEIKWNGREKFYSYVEWIEYLIEHFLKPWGRKLSGSVQWEGEDRQDVGTILIRDNRVGEQARESNAERFDALVSNVDAAPTSPETSDAQREIIEALWQELTPEQEDRAFEALDALEKRAAKWAKASDASGA